MFRLCQLSFTVILLLSLTSIRCSGQALEEPLRAAAAVRKITPQPLLPVSGGLGPTQPVTRALGDLTARAVVLQAGDTTVALVSVDLLGFPSVLCDRVRRRVPRVAAGNILIGATHTHSAPDCYAFPDGQGGHTGDLNYIEFVCRQTADAINAAYDQLQPAQLRVATGEAEGKIAYNYYAPDLYDRRMSVLQAATPQGETIFTLVNYAIHPEVLGNEVGALSPDLVGPLTQQLESLQGGIALFFNGAQGGMVTADNRDLEQPPADPLRAVWHDQRTWEECQRIGQLMAREADRLIGTAPWQPQPRLSCRTVSLQLPVDSDALWEVVTRSPLGYPHQQDRTITTRISLVNLGTAQILTIPGEALPNIGFYLKRKMRGEHNLLFGLTHDAMGYIMTEVDFASFPRYSYISRVSLGERTGEILLDTARQLIRDEQRPAP